MIDASYVESTLCGRNQVESEFLPFSKFQFLNHISMSTSSLKYTCEHEKSLTLLNIFTLLEYHFIR